MLYQKETDWHWQIPSYRVVNKSKKRRGLVEHVSRRLYVNKLAHELSPRELVGILRPDAYISLESALAEWRISTQSPSALTCVTTGFPRKFRGPSVQIVYRHIAKKLHWGLEVKRTRHGSYRIAEPEKTLLDWIYLQRQEGLPTAFDELNLRTIDWKKLHRYALKYPQSVRKSLGGGCGVVTAKMSRNHGFRTSDSLPTFARGKIFVGDLGGFLRKIIRRSQIASEEAYFAVHVARCYP